MRYVEVDGLRVSVIGLGTWQFGTREWGYGHEYAHQVAPDLVHRATELGITLIDTAESYGPRTSEHIVGEAVLTLEAEARASLTIATKFTPLAPTEGSSAARSRAARGGSASARSTCCTPTGRTRSCPCAGRCSRCGRSSTRGWSGGPR